jgi:hypothetical protein
MIAAKLLLEKGADLYLADKNCLRPLALAYNEDGGRKKDKRMIY